MMISVSSLLSQDDLARCREALEGAEWEDGRVTAGHQATGVKRNLQLPLASAAAKTIGDIILARLGQCPVYIASVLPLRVLPPRINRHEQGGTYGNHIDNALMRMPGGDAYVRTDVSCTVFLNEPDSYEGGELVIEDSYGEHRVKRAAGDMIIYPGTSHHRVEPVTAGVRLASFFWTQSLVASELNRRTLFELDGAIQRLTADHPGHRSIAELTGVYHNLLRQWSAT